jgi:hypothetical protein
MALAVTGVLGIFLWSLPAPKAWQATIVDSIPRILGATDVMVSGIFKEREGRHVPSVE